MIHRIVQFALRQRFLILMLVGRSSPLAAPFRFKHMPVDAYPDLSPPMVEIITQWPGHAAEEVERLVTLPTEVEMNGVPKMEVHAFDFALRPVRRDPDVRRRHGRLFCARRSSSSGSAKCHISHRRYTVARAAVQPLGPRLSLRDPKPGPLAAGTEDMRRLGHRARIQAGAGRRGRFRIRRHGDAVSSAARSGATVRLSHHRSASAPAAFHQQRQRRRRLLFARRPVLLRARHRA